MCIRDRWRLYGYYEYKAALRGNSVVGKQEGPNNVRFQDGTVITFNCPSVRISGFLYGDRIIELFGDIHFEDKKNDLGLKLTFTERGFFGFGDHDSDYFTGDIVKLSNPEIKLSKVEGSFIGNIKFDGKCYWDLEKIDPFTESKIEEPLPSDCRYREDANYLARKDLDKAQEWKVKLEVLQRADRRLRHEFADRMKKTQ
eukprot:TRINITY_DN8156_c0_g1_i4.p1 TRINITY_DN8156_c0_g1~~TRINITY_DN8156_c0_g1_i4.p1  ORF type:complete len:199 (+),score=51.57 TRINITY_DN8156_c0_g1_i4:64-660(+)